MTKLEKKDNKIRYVDLLTACFKMVYLERKNDYRYILLKDQIKKTIDEGAENFYMSADLYDICFKEEEELKNKIVSEKIQAKKFLLFR